MLFKKRTAAQKRYIQYIRDDVYNTAAKFKKRYQIFPWNKISKVPSKKYTNKVKVFDTEFTVKELLNEIKKAKARIKLKSEPKFYFPILNGFVMDLRGTSDEEVKALYKTFKTQLDNEFKSVEMDLEFCLTSLKALNAFMKVEANTLKESSNDSSLLEGSEELKMSELLKEMENATPNMDEFYEAVMEAVDAMEDADDLQSELTTEGANFDMHKLLKNFKKEFKKLRVEFNKLLKENRFKEARKCVDDMEKEMDYYYRKVLDVDSTIFETQIGNLIHSIIFTAKTILLAPANFVTFGMVREYQDAKENLVQNTHTANTIRDAHKKRLTSGAFNKYKNDVLEAIDRNKKTLRKLDKMVDRAEAAYKKAEIKSVKESTEYHEAVKTLYESCSEGKITLDEREELLAQLNTNAVLGDEIARVDNSMIAKEKYDAVAKALYKRCQDGEITVDEREQLLDKAKATIFQIKENDKVDFMDSQESTEVANNNMIQKPADPKTAEKVQQNLQKETEKITENMNKEMDKAVSGN